MWYCNNLQDWCFMACRLLMGFPLWQTLEANVTKPSEVGRCAG